MLRTITWTEFISAITFVAVAWYSLVFLLILRQKKRGGQSTDPLAKDIKGNVAQSVSQDSLQAHTNDLMGAVRKPEGLESLAMDGFGFADSVTPDEQLGLIPDVLEDLREIFAVIEKEDGSKHDFFSLVGIVKEKYPAIRTTGRLPEINAFITRNAPFFLSPEEIDNLW